LHIIKEIAKTKTTCYQETQFNLFKPAALAQRDPAVLRELTHSKSKTLETPMACFLLAPLTNQLRKKETLHMGASVTLDRIFSAGSGRDRGLHPAAVQQREKEQELGGK
jgi:hypothetical protein